jgi:hypothetical protein
MHFATLELPEPSCPVVADTRRWWKRGHIFCKLVGLASMPTIPEENDHNQLVTTTKTAFVRNTKDSITTIRTDQLKTKRTFFLRHRRQACADRVVAPPSPTAWVLWGSGDELREGESSVMVNVNSHSSMSGRLPIVNLLGHVELLTGPNSCHSEGRE